MLDFVVADVKDLQFGEHWYVLYFDDGILLKVEFFEGIFQSL